MCLGIPNTHPLTSLNHIIANNDKSKICNMDQNIILQQLSVPELKEIISETIRDQFEKSKQLESEQSSLPELLSAKQTALFLGISKVSLWKWSKDGKLQSYQISGRIRYKRDEIMKAVQEVRNQKYKRA
jgi:predicted DNA-binding transcriptional regulator AlpA